MVFVYILITLIILDLLITVHEFGHFLSARAFNVKVEEFALGMGPKILSYQGKKTLYSLRLFPVGGFCRMQEENQPEVEYLELLDGSIEEIKIPKDLDPSESFENKPAWQRLIILVAGVTMNFILGYLIIVIAFLISGRNLGSAVYSSFYVFRDLFGLIFSSFKMLFNGQAQPSDLTGPIGVVSVVEHYYNEGLVFLLLFSAMLSINLGIINLIPIPALDGGQIVIVLVEKLKKKEISLKLKEGLFLLSYIVLIGLAVYVAYNDILRI